ncbi:hypothetical protein AOQ84DRAFT_346672 [Glonium stellatum]|uniref:Uncharacterized protein n=1 Tax=Glonium stellatum TaxID=574774 RepID=A0A8E2ET67_9PEZI|nr:hypothetical protein AOQ84DRAFT_346672 [Glonium stellatum]
MPTFSEFIKAGDSYAYSSSMFDWIPQNNEVVSWKPLYRSLFDELVWMRKEQVTDPSRPISRLIITTPKHMKTSKRKPALQQRSPQLRFVVFRVLARIIGSINRVRDEAQSMERHMLYYRDYTEGNQQSLKSKNAADISEKGLEHAQSGNAAPKLVKNFRTLRSLNPNNSTDPNFETLYSESIWADNLRKISLREERPYIEISAEELAALSFVLGIPIALADNSGSVDLESFGAFGISLRSHRSLDGVHHLHFGYRQRDISQRPSKGSGYSTIFAKNLACGSLPFSQDKNVIHTILVDETAVKSLKRGLNTINATATALTPQTELLSRLPSLAASRFYRVSRPNNHPISLALISFPAAVATLPFAGGLTAMASLHLISAIRFTASGGLVLGKLLQRLEDLIHKVHRHAPSLELFGEYLLDGNRRHWIKTAGYLDYLPSVYDTDIPTGVARVGRYVTLLERIVALAPDAGIDPVADVSQACRLEVERAYDAAVSNYAKNARDSVQMNESIFKDIGEEMADILKKPIPFDVKTCARIARLIIVAWTYQVGIVTWTEDEKREALKQRSEAGVYCPIPIDSMPAISLVS